MAMLRTIFRWIKFSFKLVGFSLVVGSMVKGASFLCQFLSRLKICTGHCKKSVLVRDLQTEKNIIIINIISHIIHIPGNPWGFGIHHNLAQSIDIWNIYLEQRPCVLFTKFRNTSTDPIAFKFSINTPADAYSILFFIGQPLSISCKIINMMCSDNFVK